VLANSLFLIAHFHNVIIGGVLFDAMAGYNYWVPKTFGFRLTNVGARHRFSLTALVRQAAPTLGGAVVKIFLLGATGNSGRRILRLALQRAHEVTAFVRDETKLLSLVDRPISPNLHVSIGDISKSADIARVMVGHDVAINAAGNVTEGSTFTQLVQTVVDSTIISLGEGGRLWQFGGAAVLNVPGTHIMAVDLPKVPKVYEAHRTNLDVLRRSPLDWSMLCPGPMIASENSKPTGDLRLSVDEWPMTRPGYTYFLPRLALAFAFKQKVPELTISYEDAAEVILDNLSKSGRFSRRRVGVALPPGLRKYKDEVPR
jgi:putative NADH-flavin reductase